MKTMNKAKLSRIDFGDLPKIIDALAQRSQWGQLRKELEASAVDLASKLETYISGGVMRTDILRDHSYIKFVNTREKLAILESKLGIGDSK